MKKKLAIWIVLLAVGIAIAGIFLNYLDYKRNWYVPEYPTEGLENEFFYRIDPETILASLESGKSDVFVPVPPPTNDYIPPIWPTGSFSWDQEDYMKIMSTLHQFVWKESLADWKLIRATFLMDQRQNISGRFDYASIMFYQHKKDGVTNRYIRHGLRINPLYGEVSAGNDSYQYTGKWRGLDLDRLLINSADLALLFADEHGGRDARLAVGEKCGRVTVSLDDFSFEHSFLSRPFNQYDWGWKVYYKDENANHIFDMTIDPYTGKYQMLSSH